MSYIDDFNLTPLHSNTHVVALRSVYNSFSAGIDFRRQNLTSTDVRFWRLKSIPALKGLSYRTIY